MLRPRGRAAASMSRFIQRKCCDHARLVRPHDAKLRALAKLAENGHLKLGAFGTPDAGAETGAGSVKGTLQGH